MRTVSESESRGINYKNRVTQFGFWHYDIQSERYYFSQEAKNILYPREDILISSFQEAFKHIVYDDIPYLDVFVEDVFGRKISKYVEVRIQQGPDSKCVSVRGAYQEEDQSIRGIVEDVSHTRSVESLNNFKMILGSKIERITNSGWFEWKLDEDELTCSDNFFEITQIQGHNAKNRLSKLLFFSLIESQKRNFILDVMHECVTYNEEFEVTFHTSGGKEKRLKMYGYPKGHITDKKLLGVIIDVTNQVQRDESIIKGQDTERRRMSLELHDGVGQKLIAIKYMLALFKMSKNFDEFDKLNSSMDGIIDEIRTITHNLSTQIVSEVGLRNAVGQLLNECAEAIGAKRNYEFDLPDSLIISDIKGKTIYRCIQEALSNAMKYSKATDLDLKIRYLNKQIIIEISDNGIGFDSESMNKDGIGIQNIRQRVNYLYGFLKINSSKETGTSVKIKIPT